MKLSVIVVHGLGLFAVSLVPCIVSGFDSVLLQMIGGLGLTFAISAGLAILRQSQWR